MHSVAEGALQGFGEEIWRNAVTMKHFDSCACFPDAC